jgi:hypothetical protein
MRKPEFAPGESLIRNKIQGCEFCQRRYGGPAQVGLYLRACTALTDSQILSGTRTGMHNFLKKRPHSFFFILKLKN